LVEVVDDFLDKGFGFQVGQGLVFGLAESWKLGNAGLGGDFRGGSFQLVDEV